MRKLTVVLLSLPIFVSFPLFSLADDLIQVQATLYELGSSISEGTTQDELATLEARLAESTQALKLKTSQVTLPGEEAVSRQITDLYFPEGFTEPLLFKGIKDSDSYSLENSGGSKHWSTLIVPTQPTSLKPVTTGTTLRLVPTLRPDGSVQLKGSLREVTLVDLREVSDPPKVTVARGLEGTREVELTTNHRKKPVLHTSQNDISAVLKGKDSTHYMIVTAKPSCLERPLILDDPEKAEPGVARTIKNSDKDPPGTIYPARPDEDRRLLLVLRAHTFEPHTPTKPAKGKKIHLTIRMLETASDESWTSPILTSDQFQKKIREANQKQAFDLLTAPSVLAVSGLSASIEVGEAFRFPIAYDPPETGSPIPEDTSGFPVTPSEPTVYEDRETGIRVELLATARSDGWIEVHTNTSLTETSDFLNFGNPIVQMVSRPIGKRVPVVVTENQIPAPTFSSREQRSVLLLPDGGIGVAFDLIDTSSVDVSERALLGLYRKDYTERVPRRVTAFVTARLME